MQFKRCSDCDFPVLLGRWLKWGDNGTIIQRLSPEFRIVIMEADFLEDLFQRIEKALGISVRHIVFEAQRSSAKGFIGNWLKGVLGKVVRLPGARHIAITQFNKLAILGGSVYSETLDYKAHCCGVARMRNPYSKDLMAAMVVGAFEALEQKPYRHTWIEEGDDLLLRVDATEQRPEIADRMYLVFPPARPGRLRLERCPSCGVPKALGHLKWREDEGLIIDTRRNKRVNFIDAYVPGTVFREFRKELGEEVVPIIVEAQKEHFLEYIKDVELDTEPARTPEERYHELLDSLPLHGQGNPVSIVRKESHLEVVVENPYDELLLAGTMAACFQAVEAEEPEVNFKTLEEGVLQIIVRPSKR
ncbi:MAG: hypothetical protein ACYC55_02375 [Candidatus Geothermincolia bacterium]